MVLRGPSLKGLKGQNFPLSISTAASHLSLLFSTIPLFPSLHLHSPALPQEDFEAVWAALGDREVQAVVAHPPDDGRGVHILIGDLPGQHLPQHHPERPAVHNTPYVSDH